MAEETIYSPGKMSYDDVAFQQGLSYFPELDKSGHYDFNSLERSLFFKCARRTL